MASRFRRFLDRFSRPYGTPHTPASFGWDDCTFFLAVLRACPAGSTLHLDQCEDETWVEQLRPWSSRTSPEQFEADHYAIGVQFVDAVDRLLAESPSSLVCVDQIAIKGPDGRSLMTSVDNFAIILDLDDQILQALQAQSP